ncbi:exodeoxyribonuclease III [Gammaproteobacteria bacterium 45_16_T64]|nr:exodeoxyribonuclease III [Gammaproteobacteria bacterium 45_16_T64]
MKVVSFNTNGIRARPHQLEALIRDYDPDVIGIQETKVQDSEFPEDMIRSLGYEMQYHGQKGHYGVALLSKIAPITVQKGFPTDTEDAQKRLIMGEYETGAGNKITIINGYFPQGDNREHPDKFPAKKEFYEDLQTYLNENFDSSQPVIVMGDINISPQDIDIGIGPDNQKRWLRTGKCSFLPEERDWLARLESWGLSDTFRVQNPDVNDVFSWFDYRSKGFDREPKRGLRIDVILATPMLVDTLSNTGVCYDIRAMDKPSDHCPIWSEFNY